METQQTEEDESVTCCIHFSEKSFDRPHASSKNGSLSYFFANRYARTIAYGLVTIGCAAITFGWQQFQKILYMGGTYAWLCPSDWNFKQLPSCPEQELKVSDLYTVATAMEFIMGVISGVALDHLGPKCCGLMGMFMLLLGVIFLILASKSFQTYIFSMVLLGSSVNFVAFPALLAGDFFPRYQAAVIAFIVSCQIGCSSIAVVLLEIYRAYPSLGFQKLFMGYLLVIWLPCCILYFFFLPCRRRVTDTHHMIPTESEPHKSSTLPSFLIVNEKLELDTIGKETELPTSNETSFNQISGSVMKRCSGRPLERSNGADNQSVVMKGNWSSFRAELFTADIQLFAFYYVLQLLQFVYYPTTTLALFGVWMSDFAGYIMPSQIVWGILFGWSVDYVGTLTLCFWMNSLNVLVFIITLTGVQNLQYIAIVANCVSQAFIYTSKYTYVTEIYGPENFGKLSGYIGLLGGVFTFTNLLIQKSRDRSFWLAAFLVVSAICYVVLIILTIRKRRGINYFKTKATEYVPREMMNSTPALAVDQTNSQLDALPSNKIE